MDPSKIPAVKKIHEKKVHCFICLAQILSTLPDINEDSDEEKIIDVLTYPKYKIGGWIAKIGSCKIGFKPRPLIGTGIIILKGLDVKIVNEENPIIIICWNNRVSSLSLKGLVDELIIYKKIEKVKIKSHSKRLPSWLPHVPLIL